MTDISPISLVIGYAAWEGPAFYLIRRFHAPTVYAGSTIVFGLGALLTAYAKTYAHLLVARLFIGMGEATIQTGFVYMSLWYRREEMSVRTGYIFAFTPLAGAVSGLISYGIQRGLDNAAGRRSWEWLFIIEGAATLVWAAVLWFIFPDMPDKELEKKRSLWFRDPEERRLIVVRSEAGTSGTSTWSSQIGKLLTTLPPSSPGDGLKSAVLADEGGPYGSKGLGSSHHHCDPCGCSHRLLVSLLSIRQPSQSQP